MKINRRDLMAWTGGAIASAAIPAAFAAPDSGYPDRPVNLILPAPPGGTVDLLARLLQPKLSESLKQPVIVLNRGGAGGMIAAQSLKNAAPDGYNVGFVLTQFTTNAILHSDASYDPVSNFTAISLIMWAPLVLVTRPDLPASTVPELIELAKKRKLTYASGGIGTGGHMCGELFNSLARINTLHVPYKGTDLGINGVVGGQVDFGWAGAISTMSLVKAGRLKLLGVTSLKRYAFIPDVPTLDEQGVTGFDVTNWFGAVGPAKMPRPIVDRLNHDIVQALALPDIRERLAREGGQIVGSPPDEFATFLKNDTVKWRKIAATANIHLD